MAFICPVCNGLKSIQIHCETCGQPFVDVGKVSDQLDPYSPYEESHERRFSSSRCEHAIVCANCHDEVSIYVQEWLM